MDSGPEGKEPMNYKTWVLKVSIHCQACEKKMKRILHKVKGVYSIDIDATQNRVTVAGNVDADSLIQILLKYGKRAELLPEANPAAAPVGEKAVSGDQFPAETEEKKKAEKGKAVVESPESPPENPEKAATAVAEIKKKEKELKREEIKVEERDLGSNFPEKYHAMQTTVSYHSVHPSVSHAYYAAPPPEMPSSYAYSGETPSQEYAAPARYSPEYHYSSESYYRSMDQPSPAAAGSYDMFNEENPNACKLM